MLILVKKIKSSINKTLKFDYQMLPYASKQVIASAITSQINKSKSGRKKGKAVVVLEKNGNTVLIDGESKIASTCSVFNYFYYIDLICLVMYNFDH